MASQDGQSTEGSSNELKNLVDGQAEEQREALTERDSMEESSSDIPSLDLQRDIIRQALKRDTEEACEGDEVYVIPQQWYDKFFDESVTNSQDLGPLNPSSICRDYSNFILAEYDRSPYLSISKSIFESLVSWYGLAPGSQPVTTVLVHDEASNTLVTEYNRCHFRVHYLVESYKERRYSNDGPLYVTLSRLSTIQQVYDSIMEAFKRKEPNVDEKLKVWYVKDSEANEQSSILLSNYKLNPLQFMQLPVKTQITSQLRGHTLKRLGLFIGDFVIEAKQRGQNYHWLSNYFIYNTLQPSKGTTGLTNLGNTCYMNSALQCLAHVPELRDYFLYDGFKTEVNAENPLAYQGNIAQAFSLLIKSLFGDSLSTDTLAYSPSHFKTVMGRCNSMFAGYMQQDSQEFLAFLLDGLHEDLNRVHDKPYIEKPSLPPGSDISDPQIVKKLAKDTWKAHLLRNDSVITDLFVGLYESTLECPECKNVSITFDPYNDLTLPLPVDTTWCCKVKIFPQNSPPCILEVEIKKTASFQELKDYVADYAKIDAQNLYGCEIFNHQFCTNYESPDTMSQYLPVQELISDSDDVIFYELNVSEGDIVVPVLNTKLEDNFKSPQLFGVPFFLVLSPDDLKNPGAIRLKLEKQYANLSGGFIEFPLSSIEQPNDGEAFSLLKAKYKEAELNAFESALEYAVPEDCDVNQFFKIKILQDSLANITPSLPDSSPQTGIWTPTLRLNFDLAKDITELLNEITRDIYDYPQYARNIKLSSEINQEPLEGEAFQIQSDTSDMDSEKSRTPSADGEESASNKDNISENIIMPKDIIICEWPSSRVAEVFSEDSRITWEKPAQLVNTEVESRRKQSENEGEKLITIHDCLRLFSKKEVLSMNDSWYCPTCKDHRQATKQIQLWSAPDILLIHLKRFENQRSFSDKIDDTVQFPIKSLDMKEHLVHEDPRGSVYDLIAVDNHYGGLGGGHYTAYAKTRGKWFYFDDSRVTETRPESSIAGSAYLLFYVRRTESGRLGSEKLQKIILQSRKEHDFKVQQMFEQQRVIYATNKTDEEDLTDSNDDEEQKSDGQLTPEERSEGEANMNSSNEILGPSRSTDYSIASLEVGMEESDGNGGPDDNLSRRKLRLLNKTYTEQSEAASPASSVSSDGADSISAVLTGSKINDESLPKSPEKE